MYICVYINIWKLYCIYYNKHHFYMGLLVLLALFVCLARLHSPQCSGDPTHWNIVCKYKYSAYYVLIISYLSCHVFFLIVLYRGFFCVSICLYIHLPKSLSSSTELHFLIWFILHYWLYFYQFPFTLITLNLSFCLVSSKF